MQTVFLIGRIIVGLYFIKSGYDHFAHLAGNVGYAQSKGLPMPKAAVIVTGIMLALGGLSILLGLWPTYGIALIVIFLVATLFTMHTFWKTTDPGEKMGDEINFYKNLALAGALLMILAIPQPWVYSLAF